MTPADMEARIVRYGALQPCKTAFIDAHTPGGIETAAPSLVCIEER